MISFSEHAAAEIRAEVARQSLSQRVLGQRLGWSQPRLSRRMSGQVSFTLAEVEEIAAALEVPLRRLILPQLAMCAYCGREQWHGHLQPCCGRVEHIERLVCRDTDGCLRVILLRLHDQDRADAARGLGEPS